MAGNAVTSTGYGFTNGVGVFVGQVLFGSNPAPSFTVTSHTTLTAVIPPGSGTVPVAIMDMYGTNSVIVGGAPPPPLFKDGCFMRPPMNLIPSFAGIAPEPVTDPLSAR